MIMIIVMISSYDLLYAQTCANQHAQVFSMSFSTWGDETVPRYSIFNMGKVAPAPLVYQRLIALSAELQKLDESRLDPV